MSRSKSPRKLRIKLFSVRGAERPFDGSVCVFNHLLIRALRSLGHSVEHFHGVCESGPAGFIPLKRAGLANRLRSDQRGAGGGMYIFDDSVIAEFGPLPEMVPQTILMLHGLLFNFHQLFQMPCFGRVWTTSEYLKQVYLSVYHLISMEGPAQSPSDCKPAVESIRVPLPILEFPGGYKSAGAVLPTDLVKAMQGSDLFGAMLRPMKGDPEAAAAIVFHLNDVLRSKKVGQRCYLIVPQQDLGSLVAAARDHGISDGVERYLIPLPPLRNADLLRLLKRCGFSLCYDQIPDAFGFYPLESVFCGCPVYSNGCGNLRHLLPAEHGIELKETFPMVFGDKKKRVAAYRDVAVRILDQSQGQAKSRAELGRRYIHINFGTRQFKESLLHALARRGSETRQATLEQRATSLRLSPLVRSIDLSQGLVISDYRSTRLTRAEVEVLTELDRFKYRYPLKRLAGSKSEFATAVELCRKGVLACLPDRH